VAGLATLGELTVDQLTRFPALPLVDRKTSARSGFGKIQLTDS